MVNGILVLTVKVRYAGRGVNGSRALIESGPINRRARVQRKLNFRRHSPSCCCEMFHACSPARLTTTAFSMTSFCALQRTALQQTRGDLIKSILLKATFRNDLRNTFLSPHSQTKQAFTTTPFAFFMWHQGCVRHTRLDCK